MEKQKLVICPNCHGAGEKLRWRGNHPSVSRVTVCYTCMGSGEVTNEQREAFLQSNK